MNRVLIEPLGTLWKMLPSGERAIGKVEGCAFISECGRGNIWVRGKEIQTFRYKISYRDILYKMGNVAGIL